MWLSVIFGIILYWALISKIDECLSKFNRRENSEKDGYRLSNYTLPTNPATPRTYLSPPPISKVANAVTLPNNQSAPHQQESVPFSISNVGHYLLLDLTQRSDEWLKWRDNGIGASDAPTIMGETRWKPPDSLLREKVYGAPQR